MNVIRMMMMLTFTSRLVLNPASAPATIPIADESIRVWLFVMNSPV